MVQLCIAQSVMLACNSSFVQRHIISVASHVDAGMACAIHFS